MTLRVNNNNIIINKSVIKFLEELTIVKDIQKLYDKRWNIA